MDRNFRSEFPNLNVPLVVFGAVALVPLIRFVFMCCSLQQLIQELASETGFQAEDKDRD